MNKLRIFFLVLFIFLVPSQFSQAADRFSLVPSRPVADGGSFFAVQNSHTLSPGQWTAGTALSFGYLPLRGTSGGASVNIVEDLLVQNFFGSIGLYDWLSVSADLPVAWANYFSNPDTLSTQSIQSSLSDLFLSSKIKILDQSAHNFGIALAPFVSLPTGDEATFVGDESATGGMKIVLDGTFGSHVFWALNTGVLLREEYNAYGLNFDDQILLSAGLGLKARHDLSIMGEVDAKTSINNFLENKNVTPVETRLGTQWRFGRNDRFILNTAGTFGVTYGSGVPHYGALVGFAYRSPSTTTHVFKQNVTKEIQQKIYFSSNSSRLTLNGKRQLDTIASIISTSKWIKHMTLIGHADRFGDSAYNQSLSLQRAQTVQKYLFGHMTRSIEIRVQGMGENTERCVEISL